MAGALSLCDTESVIIKVFRKDFHGLAPSGAAGAEGGAGMTEFEFTDS
jgi:hypothetical protein